MPAADQHQARRPRGRAAAASRGTSAVMYGGASSTLPDGVLSISRSRGTIGPEVDAVRARPSTCSSVSPSGTLAVAVAERARADLQVEHALGPARASYRDAQGRPSRPCVGREHGEEAVVDRVDVDVARCACRAAARRGGSGSPTPAGRPSSGGKTARRVRWPPLPTATLPDQVVEVRLLERGQPGQDHVRVACRLVEVVVDADHALELGERRRRARPASGAPMHRVAGDRDQRADLPRRPAWRSPRRGTTPAPGRAPRARRARGCASGRIGTPPRDPGSGSDRHRATQTGCRTSARRARRSCR